MSKLRSRPRRVLPPVSGLAVIALAVIALFMAGCDGPGAAVTAGASDSPRASDTVVVASPIDIRTVNELTADITLLHQAIHNYALFQTLLDEQADYESGPPTFEPLLAESYELSDDHTVITFRLRGDVVWSDGVPLTAEDVRWTWQAQTHPAVGWVQRAQKQFIEDVEVVDAHTVRFHLEKAYATQLLDVNLGVILPKHAWSRLPFEEWRQRADWFLEPGNLVVSGPFTLERWEPGERIVLKRNDRYFRPGLPRSERIIFRVVPDRAGQLALLNSGQAHIVEWARPADAIVLKKNPDIEVMTYIPRGPNVLIWNLSHPFFAAKEVRQALTLALDRQTIIDTLYYGYANVTDSLYTSNVWIHNEDVRPWPHDPERARQLLAAQGWSDTDGDGVLDRDGQRFSFELLTTTGNELREDILVMVQDQLARIGVETRQRAVEFNTLVSRTHRHQFEVALNGIGIPTNLDLWDYFHSTAIESGFNMSSYSSPEMDRILEQIKTQVDFETAKPLYDELQALLREDLPVTVLYEPWRMVPVSKAVAGVFPNAVNTYYHLEEWELRAGD